MFRPVRTGRLPGWIDQWSEMIRTGHDIGRPAQDYPGATERDYTAISSADRFTKAKTDGAVGRLCAPGAQAGAYGVTSSRSRGAVLGRGDLASRRWPGTPSSRLDVT